MTGHYSNGAVTKNRGKWLGLIWYTDGNGERHRLSKSLKEPDGSSIPCEPNTNRGKNRAIAALDRWRAELISADEQSSARHDGTLDGVTLAEFMDAYLDELRETHHVEPSTMVGYVSSAKRISTALGDVPVLDLTTQQIQAWEASMMNEEGLTARTVTKNHRLLSQALKSAVADGRLERNPCDRVKLPKQKREQPHAMTKEQTNDLLATLAAMPQTRAVAAARISLGSGMRLGEICALTWADVDMDAGMVRVRRSVGIGKGGSYVKGPKTAYSNRDIPITPQLADAFRSRRSYVLAEAQKLDVTPSPSQLAACYVLGDLSGNLVNPSNVGKEWMNLRRLLGITDAEGRPLKFHDLRHTYATLAVQAGADIKSVSSMLGHANANMTLNVYASSDEDARRHAADRIAAFMGETPKHGQVETFRPNGTEE